MRLYESPIIIERDTSIIVETSELSAITFYKDENGIQVIADLPEPETSYGDGLTSWGYDLPADIWQRVLEFLA